MSLLEELFTKYGTDKGIWGYTPAYEKYLEPIRLDVKNVLEIGICGERDIPNNVIGASLFVWREYFPNAQIYGIDNDPKWVFNDQSRITTACVDAYHSEVLRALMNHWNVTFDFICDDAVHDPFPQVQLINDLAPFIKENGIYAIEECCPYKIPNGDISNMVRLFPPVFANVEEVRTHKDERLLLCR